MTATPAQLAFLRELRESGLPDLIVRRSRSGRSTRSACRAAGWCDRDLPADAPDAYYWLTDAGCRVLRAAEPPANIDAAPHRASSPVVATQRVSPPRTSSPCNATPLDATQRSALT